MECRVARITAAPAAPGEEGAEAPNRRQEWEIAVPGRAAVDLDPSLEWSITAFCPGSWAPEVQLEPGSAETGILFSLLPTGRLTGRLEPAERVREVEGPIRLRLQPATPAGDPGWRRSTFICPVDGARFDCEVPAGEVDLRVAAAGFAPHYAWGVRVPAADTHDLGVLELVEGASVSGWVRVAADSRGQAEPAEASVLVTVEPALQGTTSEAERRRLEVRGERTTADERGFFQLAGLGPGTYDLTASLPGHSPARLSPVVLDRGEEQVVERPLELEPLVTLEAYLDPPQDVEGRPWRVRLLGEGQGPAGATVHREIVAGPATVSGHWSAEGLAVGPYVLRVEDATGSMWSEVPVEVAAALPPLTIQLDAVAVAGEVLLRDEPVAAEVVFGTTTRVPSLRMKSDEEGRFQGVLPHEGEWPLEIVLPGRSPQALDPVEVRRGPGGVAELSLRLPDTRLAGEVVTEAGEPAAGVNVLVIREEAKASAPEREAGIEHRRRREASLKTDREGRFELDGLLPAPLHVMAHDAARASTWRRVDLAEDTPTESIRLVLRERAKVDGFVVSPDGPVPGAAIVGFSRGQGAPLDLFAQDVTGADGGFSIEVTAGTRIVDLLVAPPGHDLVLRRIGVGPRPLAIEVGRSGSRLVLEGVGPATVSHAGAELPIEVLVSALFPTGRIDLEQRDRLAIAGLEPGSYTLCPTEGGASCTSGFLAHRGELILRGPGAETKEDAP